MVTMSEPEQLFCVRQVDADRIGMARTELGARHIMGVAHRFFRLRVATELFIAPRKTAHSIHLEHSAAGVDDLLKHLRASLVEAQSEMAQGAQELVSYLRRMVFARVGALSVVLQHDQRVLEATIINELPR
jgi:hypothetical protein